MEEKEMSCIATDRSKPCGRKTIKENLCIQHWTLLQRENPKIVDEKKERRTEEKKEKEEVAEKECSVCFELVDKTTDAFFDCSFFKTGCGSCVIHTECARSLRDDRCPTCRSKIDLKKLVSQKVIDQRKREDYLEYTGIEPPGIEGEEFPVGIPDEVLDQIDEFRLRIAQIRSLVEDLPSIM